MQNKNAVPYKVTPEEYRCKEWFCEVFSHWLNPFGNWEEPMPFPEIRKKEAEQSWLHPFVWWNLYRNPLTNFCHHWIGITPIGERYSWYSPEDNGWTQDKSGKISWWKKKGRISLPYYRYDGKFTFYIGWTSRGNFGVALRRNIG